MALAAWSLPWVCHGGTSGLAHLPRTWCHHDGLSELASVTDGQWCRSIGCEPRSQRDESRRRKCDSKDVVLRATQFDEGGC